MKIKLNAYGLYDCVCEVSAQELATLNSILSRLRKYQSVGDGPMSLTTPLGYTLEVLSDNVSFVNATSEE